MHRPMIPLLLLVALAACDPGPPEPTALAGAAAAPQTDPDQKGNDMPEKMNLTDDEWRQRLTPEQFRILREAGTEPAFSGEYADSKTPGVYLCAGCGNELFSSETKYDSGSGWPSFYAPIAEQKVATSADHSHGMRRTEVTCARCGGHLGHVFDDGPDPTGLRYCINSAALQHERRQP